MDIVGIKNVATYGSTRRLSPAGTGAQVAGANATVTGPTFDRYSFGTMPRSAEIAAIFDSTLAAGKTLSFSFLVQQAPDGVNWTTFAASGAPTTITSTTSGGSVSYTYAGNGVPVAAPVLAATGGVGGSTQQGQCSIPVDLNGAQRYIRVLVTPVMSAASTDTVTFLTTGFFAGGDRLPAAV